MIGALIVFAAACTIVIGYITTVNWFLRQDEYYHESIVPVPTSSREPASAINAMPAQV